MPTGQYVKFTSCVQMEQYYQQFTMADPGFISQGIRTIEEICSNLRTIKENTRIRSKIKAKAHWDKFAKKLTIKMVTQCVKFVSVKTTIMQIEKAKINDCPCVWKVFWKFRIPAIYNFAVIYPWNLLYKI